MFQLRDMQPNKHKKTDNPEQSGELFAFLGKEK
jgi:hypothetical protein